MAQTITGIMQSKVINQLDTYNHTALLNSMYTVECRTTEQPPSGLSIVIQQNGSTKYTSEVPAASQEVIDSRIVLNCTAGDTITVIYSSSAPIDQGGNSMRSILKITPGII